MRVPGRRALRSASSRARCSSARSLENSPRSPWRIVESGRPAGNPRPDFWPTLASSLPSWKVAPPPTGAEGRPHFSLRPSQPRPARGAPCRLSPRGTSQTCPSFQRHRRPPRWPPRLRPEPQHSFLPAAARGLGKSQIRSWFSLLQILDGVPRDRKPNPSASLCPTGQPASPRRHRPGHSSSSPVARSASSPAASTLPAPGPCARCTRCLAGRSRPAPQLNGPFSERPSPPPTGGDPSPPALDASSRPHSQRACAPRVLRACLCLFPGCPAPARVSAAEGRTRRPGAMPGTPRALRDHVPKGHATSPTAQAPEGPSSSRCHLAGSRTRLPGADSPPGAGPIHPWGPSSSRPLRSVYREGRR